MGIALPRRLWREFSRDKLVHVAAGVAFFGLLALFPGVTAALALIGLILDPGDVIGEFDRLAQILPRDAADIILAQAHAVAEAGETRLGLRFVFTTGLAFWSASRGMQGLIDGLNMAHNEQEQRSYLHQLALRLGLTFLLIFGLIMGVSMAVVIPATFEVLRVPYDADSWLARLRWPVMGILTLAGLRLIYRLGPDHSTPHTGILTWGTVFAATAWVAASLGFSYYVANFASYNQTFGALGGVIILLMWLWISALVILFGAEIDSALEAERSARDSPLS